MADPQRLVEDPDASPLARSLLASAEGDAPSARRRAAVARRLGIAAALLGASGEVGAGGVIGAVGWKIGLVVVAIASVITGGVALTREPARQPAAAVAERALAAPAPGPAPAPSEPMSVAAAPNAPAPSAPMSEATAPSAPATVVAPTAVPRPAHSPRSQPRAAAPSPVAPAPPTTPSPAAPAPAASPESAAPAAESAAPSAEPTAAPSAPPAPPAPAPAVDARRLAAEVAILDRAGAALRLGDTAAAAAALDEHARDFADGALLAEAELLRIEALVRAGDAAQAHARAGAFLVRFPQSPLRKRLRSLLERGAPADKPADDPANKESP